MLAPGRGRQAGGGRQRGELGTETLVPPRGRARGTAMFKLNPSTIKGERRLPERRGRQCTRGWREPSRWQTCLLHPEPSPRLQPLVRESIIRANQFGTERPGRESARRDAVRLDVRPAPTSSTDPPAILATRTHSETKMSDQPQLAEHIPKPSSQPRLTLKFCRFRNFRATTATTATFLFLLAVSVKNNAVDFLTF